MSAPDAAAVVDALGRDGYLIVKDMLSPQEVARAKAELAEVLAGIPYGRNDFEGHATRRIYAIFAKTRLFDGPATHPLVLAVLDQLLGHYQLSAPTGIEIGPGESAQPLHPDDGIYPIPRPHAELVVNVMWPLDDFTEANGATRIVPGSHRWGDRVPGEQDATVSAEMPAGSMLIYRGSLWHGGGANDTDRPRLGVIMHYAVSWLRQQESHLLAVPREIARELPRRLQELLGYNIAPPFIGYVDGRHPRRVLGY
ncbi:phytanoyl-CoA dioxygenase family protein [Streptosporangiaceae bacterium NEAU-GS5]|nr:phytanoyl-CoA dioxygenase family protein [Streptosporangiaceae bacterium NEAU-GS5]